MSSQNKQATDVAGNVVMNASHVAEIAVNGTTTITGTLYPIALVIFSEVASGTWYVTDSSDAEIVGLPFSDRLGKTDYVGTYPLYRLPLTNGLKIVTASATGLVAGLFYAK